MKRRESDVPDSRSYPGKVKRLAIALERSGMPWEEALEVIASAKGLPESDKPAMGRWFAEHLPPLEARMEPERFKRAMEDCACCKGGERHRQAVEIRNAHDTMEARLEALGQAKIIIGDHIERVDARTFRVHFYPDSWGEFHRCGCLRYGPGQQAEPMPRSFCVCCGGHIKGHCEAALGVPLTEEIVTSSLTTCGREGCVIELKLAE